ncbi:Hypothetical protein HDN1F_34450 [gamma proteobacterium HdN1]|nr:Hypothetical protein HDN1F_34450 [gamma proteobacterium HdN1]
MNNQQGFFGFEISADLYHSCTQVIKDLQLGQNLTCIDERAAENIVRLADTGFEVYYDKPSNLVEFSSILRKAADAGIHAVQKAAHLVIRKVLIGMPISELSVLSDYMANLLCTDGENPERYYICFTLSDELFQLAQTLLARVRTDSNVDLYRAEIIGALEQLIQVGVDVYYAKPVGQIKLGRIARKASDLGIRTAHKGTTTVLHKLLGEMPHEAMIPLAAYFESLLHDQVQVYQRDAA